MECYQIINFQKDLAGFEANQQVILSRVRGDTDNRVRGENNNRVRGDTDRIRSDTDWLINCQSKQDTSTPGMILKSFQLPKNNQRYCLEVTGRANCRKAFVQVIEPESGRRLITGYQYLPEKLGTILVNFKADVQLVQLAVLFGGTEKPAIGDQFWLKSFALTNRDLTEQPQANHQQEIQIRRFYDPKPLFLWTNPIKVETLPEPTITDLLSESVEPPAGMEKISNIEKTGSIEKASSIVKTGIIAKVPILRKIQIPDTNIVLSLESDGTVRWFEEDF